MDGIPLGHQVVEVVLNLASALPDGLHLLVHLSHCRRLPLPAEMIPNALFRHTALALSLCLTLSACDHRGPTDASSGDATLHLTDEVASPEVVGSPIGEPLVACSISLHVEVQGTPGASVRWVGATVHEYAASDPSIGLDSMSVDAAMLRQMFGADSLAVGEQSNAVWRAQAAMPFEVLWELKYHVGADGPVKVAKFFEGCGPSASPDGTPGIWSFTLRPREGDVEPGDTLTAVYAVSGATLDHVTLHYTGGFSRDVVIDGYGAGYAIGRVQLVIPPRSTLHEPVSVVVEAVGDAGRVARSDPLLTPPLEDHRPPQLDLSHRFIEMSGTQMLEGAYAAGDTLRLIANMEDNEAPGFLIYQFRTNSGITRDSLRWTVPAIGFVPVNIPLPPERVGRPELRVFLRDSVGNESVPLVSRPDSLQIVPVRQVTIAEATRDGGGGMPPLAFDYGRNLVFAAYRAPDQLVAYSLPTLAAVATVPMDTGSTAMDLGLSGDSLLLAAGGSLEVFDAGDLRATPARVALDTVVSSNGAEPSSLLVLRTGRVLLGVEFPGFRPAVGELDLATGKIRSWRTDMSVLYGRSADGTHAFVRSMECNRSYDAVSDELGPCLPGDPGAAAFSADGQRLAIGTEVYDAAGRLVREVAIGGRWASEAVVSAMSPDGSAILAVLGRRLYRFRVADGQMLDAFNLRLPDGPIVFLRRVFMAGPHTVILMYEEDLDAPPFFRQLLYAVPLD